MNRKLIGSLTEAERLLVAETEPAALAALDEDQLVELHARVRRARTKYVKLYRRGASARVVEQGGRGKARPKSTRDAGKAEVFEDALARVSRSLAAAARQSAADLRAERIAAARSTRSSAPSAPAPAAPGRKPRSAVNRRVGDRSLRSASSKKKAASVTAAGARRQAKRDSR